MKRQKERNSRVLLVEGEALSPDSIADVLRGAGIVVEQVHGDQLGPALARRHYDLLVLDVPARERWGRLEEIHKREEPLPVLVLSTHGTEARARPFRECVAAYLFRPVTEGEILGTCDRILGLARRSEAFSVERRRVRRRRFLARVQLGADDGEAVPGVLLDVSEHGFQAELSAAAVEPKVAGERVRVRVLTAGEGPVLTGRICWWHARPTGYLFGAELDDADEGNTHALSQLLPP